MGVSYSDGTPAVSYGYDGVANGMGQLTSVGNLYSDDEFHGVRCAAIGDGE